MIVRSQVYSLIGPFWFRVLSTFETGISLDNLTSSSPHFFANCSSIKTPCAPLSMRALVAADFFPLMIFVSTCIDFRSGCSTLLIVRALIKSPLEDLDVATSLHIENPVLLLLAIPGFWRFLQSFRGKQSLLVLILFLQVPSLKCISFALHFFLEVA